MSYPIIKVRFILYSGEVKTEIKRKFAQMLDMKLLLNNTEGFIEVDLRDPRFTFVTPDLIRTFMRLVDTNRYLVTLPSVLCDMAFIADHLGSTILSAELIKKARLSSATVRKIVYNWLVQKGEKNFKCFDEL